ncbi:MAG: N-glycosylase/DNA lyase [Candidatus Gracilibacteria bacterium]|nr:N-glycosylase/DNA lyase [Candidatus Gracilibacteria bacterium]
MQELLNKFKNISLEDIIALENSDRQFIAIKNIYEKNKNISINNYLSLVIANALLAYQLSGTGEDYWEEFSSFVINYDFSNKLNIKLFFDDFLGVCACNKRLINMKKIRINKINDFLEIFTGKEEFFYNNMDKMGECLADKMKQKNTDKTIVFAIKMFGYAGRNIWGFKAFPYNISIPIDSRITKIYNKYNKDSSLNINSFYKILSEKLGVSPLHLDSLLWINSDKLI